MPPSTANTGAAIASTNITAAASDAATRSTPSRMWLCAALMEPGPIAA